MLLKFIIVSVGVLAVFADASYMRLPVRRKHVVADEMKMLENKFRGDPVQPMDASTTYKDGNLEVGITFGGGLITVSLDATVSTSWVPLKSCTSPFCKKAKTNYDDKNKNTCDTSQTKSFNGLVEGYQCHDTIRAGSDDYSGKFTFTGASYVDNSVGKIVKTSGIFGLGPGMPISGLAPSQPIVGLTIPRRAKSNLEPTGEIYFGGLPSGLTVLSVETKPIYIPSVSQTSWKFNLDYVSSIDGFDHIWSKAGANVLIDTMMEGISGPAREIYSINAFIGADDDGMIDCYKRDMLLPLVFHIGGHPYELPAESFIVEGDEVFNHKCKTVFIPSYDFNGQWKLGLSFLEQYLTVFDYDLRSIALLKLKPVKKTY